MLHLHCVPSLSVCVVFNEQYSNRSKQYNSRGLFSAADESTFCRASGNLKNRDNRVKEHLTRYDRAAQWGVQQTLELWGTRETIQDLSTWTIPRQQLKQIITRNYFTGEVASKQRFPQKHPSNTAAKTVTTAQTFQTLFLCDVVTPDLW